MLRKNWRAGSLRARVTIAIALAVLPLAISSVADMALDRKVVADYREIGQQYNAQVVPTENLQDALSDAEDRVFRYVATGDVADKTAYQADRRRIETDFADLHKSLGANPQAVDLLGRAENDWRDADRVMLEVLAVDRAAAVSDTAASVRRFDAIVDSATDRLGALSDHLTQGLDRENVAAYFADDHSIWLGAAAGVISFICILIGLAMFGHLIRSSVDRLVEGAARFAAGDRNHRIDVQVPPELHKVATEFNRMIERIHDSEEALEEQARRDGLTGLLNRRAFDEAIADIFARMERLDERVAVLSVDLDHFKTINDTFGHAAGDDVIRETVHVMLTCLRKIDRAYRMGGEEFVVLLPGADLKAAEAVAERIREAVEADPVKAGDHDIPVTVSIGVAVASSPDPGRVATLMKSVDEALYAAKQSGRNRVVVAGDHQMLVAEKSVQKKAS